MDDNALFYDALMCQISDAYDKIQALDEYMGDKDENIEADVVKWKSIPLLKQINHSLDLIIKCLGINERNENNE
jgi:hypothetical protein